MRTMSAAWSDLLAYSHRVVCRVESWLDGVQLAGDLPVTEGSITYDDTGTLKRRLSLTVPARTPAGTLDPAGDPSAPLAAYGQRLHVALGVGWPNGAVELADHGWYLITSWERDDAEGTIAVEAFDLAQLLVDDRLTAPSSPPANATFGSEFARLMDGLLPAVVDPGLVDRAIAGTTVWDRDRDAALNTLCQAWPARWYVGDDGAAHVAPTWPAVTAASTPDVELTDGVGGTVVTRARRSERGALYNVLVVDGRQPDNGTARPHAVAQITDAASPIRATGPYGRVVRFYESDLITTQPQAQNTADSLLVTYASAGRVESATAVPDPALQLGDVARIYTADGHTFTGRITGLALPLTAAGGAMTVTIGTLPAEEL